MHYLPSTNERSSLTRPGALLGFRNISQLHCS